MSIREFKKDVLDHFSPSFCGAKWYNATIWLNSGDTTSCHHPPKQSIPLVELETNPTAIHNTLHKKKMRKLMQEGIRPSECEYCWKVEDMETNEVSDRTYKSIIYHFDYLKAAYESNWQDDVNLKTVELSFGRQCNLACSYCNSDYSTTWGNDIKKNGIYTDLLSDGRLVFMKDGSAEDLYEKEDDNPYIKAWWKWWESDLKNSLFELRLTGGEPLLSKDTWKLFDYFEKENLEMQFAINSNLMVSDRMIDKLIDRSRYVNDFVLYTSMEATNDQANFIRDPADYEKWKTNLHKFMLNGNYKYVTIMMTINALCLFSITEFLDDMMELRKEFGKGPFFSLNILRFPSFQAIPVLPKNIRDKIRMDLENWMDINGDNIFDFEKPNITRLIDYLQMVDSPHMNATTDQRILHRDFKLFYDQYSIRRNKSIEVFPDIFTDWYSQIETDLQKIDAFQEKTS